MTTRAVRLRGRVVRELGRVLDRAPLLAFNAFQRSWWVPRSVRFLVLRLWGIDARTRRISEGCWFGGRRIAIGQETFVNMGCTFDNLGEIRVGDSCHIGMSAMIITSTHVPGGESSRAGEPTGEPVVIEDGCWIGAGAIILPGVTVGRGCVVGSGAVVAKDCEPNGLYAGNPARRIRDLGHPAVG